MNIGIHKTRLRIWDSELTQYCGYIIKNSDGEFIFTPDRISFDRKQLLKITKLLKSINDALGRVER